MKKAIVWILYAAFVGVLIYGAVVRTNAISAARGSAEYSPREGEGRYSGREWRYSDEQGSQPEGRRLKRFAPQGRLRDDSHDRPRWHSDQCSCECEPQFGPRQNDNDPRWQPRDNRRGGRGFAPDQDEALNDYAERYFRLDDFLKEESLER